MTLGIMTKNMSGMNAHNGESLLSVSLRIRTLRSKLSIWVSEPVTVTLQEVLYSFSLFLLPLENHFETI